ncbi:MAG: 2-amino-4-hydroxy-6-hydroxymethyldihydropteridine diphosphokinase [Pseudomonadota bacterium]
MILIGLGSNLGDSPEVVLQAMSQLSVFALPDTLVCSRLWQTSPVDCPPDSGLFINAAVAFEAIEGLTPEGLLRELKELERAFGRGQKIVRNAPRELDLDLLVFNSERRDETDFVLPHPRATQRLFVLAPLAEVAGDVQWPGTGCSIQELLDGLETDEQVTPLSTGVA